MSLTPTPPSLLPLAKWHTLRLICQCARIIGVGHAWCVRDRMSRKGLQDGERDKRGKRWQMKRDQQKRAVYKSRMEGNRWIDSVRQKERRMERRDQDGWGISTWRQIERDYFQIPALHNLSTGIGVGRWLLTRHTKTYIHTELRVAKTTCWVPAETWVILSVSLRHDTYKQTYCAAWVPPLQEFWHVPDKK